MAPRRIDAATLRGWIAAGGELAVLDAREEGEFGAAHLFRAVPCPLSQAELRAPALLPRRGVRVCCVDGGEGYAERLAALLHAIGCTDAGVLDGGTPAWAAAGGVLFSGVNVPSKAFGEWVEHHYGTPSIDPAELAAMQARGDDMVVLDSRPMDEFRAMSIPGGVCVPGGELVYRIAEYAPDPATTVVVNCAGRTRSILGAESLRSAGVPNRVVALRNGTMGWELAGFAAERGATRGFAPGVPDGADGARARAAAFAARHGVAAIDAGGLARWQADPARTTHVLDVRDAAEFAAGHLPGSTHAPGGQLVQATDRWVAVRGARIVLIDGAAFGQADGVRARMAGGWLRQMGAGYEVAVLEGALPGPLATGPIEPRWPEAASLPTIAPAELHAALGAAGLVVVQLSRSLAFRAAHVPGALWGVRTRLHRLRDRLADARRVVLVAEPGPAAHTAAELRALAPHAELARLDGGLDAWRAAGLPLVADPRDPPDAACIDTYLRPYDRNDGVAEAMRAYLDWEVALVDQVRLDGDARFG